MGNRRRNVKPVAEVEQEEGLPKPKIERPVVLDIYSALEWLEIEAGYEGARDEFDASLWPTERNGIVKGGYIPIHLKDRLEQKESNVFKVLAKQFNLGNLETFLAKVIWD